MVVPHRLEARLPGHLRMLCQGQVAVTACWVLAKSGSHPLPSNFWNHPQGCSMLDTPRHMQGVVILLQYTATRFGWPLT